MLVDGALGGLGSVGRQTPHAGKLVADTVLLVVELAVLDEETDDKRWNRQDDGNDQQNVHVVVVGVDESGPFRGTHRVSVGVREGTGVDLGTSGSIEHGKVLLEVARESVGLDSTNESVTAGTANLGKEQEVGGDCSNVLVTNADLSGNLKGDAKETTTETLEYLREDGLDVARAS